jgi:hypothetical protein
MEATVTPDILGIARRIVKYCADYAKEYIEKQKAKLPDLDNQFEFKIETEQEDAFEVTITRKGYKGAESMLQITVLNISGELMETSDIVQVHIDSAGFNTVVINNPDEKVLEVINKQDGGQLKYIVQTSFHNTLFREYRYDSLKS